jgi:putative endopeptidase
MERFNNECNDFNCGDDFYSYVNSNWITNTEIPEDYQRWGVFQILQDFTVKKIKKILDKAYKSSNSDYKKLFTIYSQYFNYDKRADPSNILYIQNIFSKINSCVTSSELFDLMFKYDLLFTISFPINIVIQSNLKNADEVILHIGSGGIGLPDRDYYFIESKENVRNKYKDFIKKYSELFGLLVDPDTIFNLEKKLAEKTLTKVQKRIPELSDNLSNWNDLIVNTPNLSFIKEIFIKSGKKPDKVNILNLEYIQFINDFIPSYNLGNWKQYFCFKIMLTFNNCLSEQIEKTYFDFYNGVILGVEKMKPLWKRSIEFTEKLLGELLGKFYVENYFNSKSKTKASEIFKYIKKELENIIKNSDWMNKETKIKAIEKLNKMNIKIGYPDKYEKDYDKIDISDKNSLLINSINIRSHDINYKIQKLYRPVDRNQWFMNAHMVNAYYSPNLNEIVFPAGILQPPFFSLDQDIAFNFGGFGCVIGHEITHGFDDQGAKYDADGNLNNWWTKEDIVKYNSKTDIVKKQYNDYEIQGEKINGELTLGENIADIGGVFISLKAFENYLKDHQDENIKKYGFSQKQLFFINYANIWKAKSRKEDTLQRLMTDPHSPPMFRVNGVLRNIDDFYQEFNISPSNSMYLKPELRAKIWT